MLINRDGVCIGAGFSSVEELADQTIVLALPTDNVDFLGPTPILGKTKEQILSVLANPIL